MYLKINQTKFFNDVIHNFAELKNYNNDNRPDAKTLTEVLDAHGVLKFFNVDDTTSDVSFTAWGEYRVFSAAKDFYADKIKKLDTNHQYLSEVNLKTPKQEEDYQAEKAAKEQYEKDYPKQIIAYYKEKTRYIQECIANGIIDPNATRTDGGTYQPDILKDEYKSIGSLFEFTCDNLQDAIEGYQTASKYCKVDKDKATGAKVSAYFDIDGFPCVKYNAIKDKEAYANGLKEIVKKCGLPDDFTNPKRYTGNEISQEYRINWRALKDVNSDNTSLLNDAADCYAENIFKNMA